MINYIKRYVLGENVVCRIFLAVVLAVFIFSFASAAPAFELNNLLLKVSMHQGDFATKSLSINSDEGGEFFLELVNLKGVKLSEESFVLAKAESKQISVSFDSSKLSPGAYAGSIKIKNGADISYLPVIFEVESKDVFFDANLDIPPQYTTIAPGDKMLAQLKIYDLTSGGTSDGLGSTKIDIDYFVYNNQGNVVSSESETVVIDKQTQLTKSLSFPKDTDSGNYIFFAVIKYKSSVGVASSMFSIEKQSAGAFSMGGSSWIYILIIGGVVFLFFAVIFIFVYMVRDRDKLMLELKRYNADELKQQQKFLLEQAKLMRVRYKTVPRRVKKEIKQKIIYLKEKHKKRVKELSVLRKKGDVAAMKEKIAQWKKQGYNTMALDYKLKDMSTGDMQKMLKKWKREYTEGYKNKK